MTDIPKQPFDHYGDYQVYLVDDFAIRSSGQKAEEFGGYATHYNFKFVPEDEIWINNTATAQDRFCYIHNVLAQLKLLKQGVDWDHAYDYGLAIERKIREQLSREPFDPNADGTDVDPEIYVNKYGEFKDEGTTVWIASGQRIRDLYRTDFVEGGHGYVYKWIPKNEIWLEDQLQEAEKPFILLHEFVEMIYMHHLNADYASAHRAAAKIEFRSRKEGLTQEQVLQWTKDDALKIAKEMKLEFVKARPTNRNPAS